MTATSIPVGTPFCTALASVVCSIGLPKKILLLYNTTAASNQWIFGILAKILI
jgi:hypothetical protein